MFIIKYKKIILSLSLALVIIAIAFVAFYGLRFGIDFTGGTLVEIEYTAGTPAVSDIEQSLATDFGKVLVQPTEDNSFILRTRHLEEIEREKLFEILPSKESVVEKRFDSIGPIIGEELRAKSYWAIALVILLIVLYITFAFRKVSKPVSSWKYGLIAVVTLLHDVVIPTGFFAIYSHFTGGEIDILFVTALLAILGFSIHDTIVVFDRIRENLRVSSGRETFEITVGKSLSQTFTRSINTSLTVALTLLALIFFGSASTTTFAWVLLVGIIAGTYSSIFVASPLLVVAESLQKK